MTRDDQLDLPEWTIASMEPYETYTGGDGNAVVEGPVLPELMPVKVVPATEVERLRNENAQLRRAMRHDW